MQLHPECFDVVSAVGPACEVAEVELYLVPALVQSHGHGADEGLDPGGALVVGGPEPASYVLVVQDLHLEGEVLLQVLDYHHQEGQLDPQGLTRRGGAGNVGSRHVRTHYLQYTALDICVCYTLDVAVTHTLVPNLQRLATDTVEYRQESGLKCVFKHNNCNEGL